MARADNEVIIRDACTEAVAQPRSHRSYSVLVKVHDTPASPQQWILTSGSLVLGAGRGADLIIGDESVSRIHLQIALSPQGVEIIDLNSSNGTYYQGQRIRHLTLDREGTFTLGRVKVSVLPQPDVDESASSEVARYGELLASSTRMKHLFSNLEQLENSVVPVLIEGDSGTGRSHLAREIHEHSTVRNGPFIRVNCASLGPTTARTELFGTPPVYSQDEAKPGAFELANEGTLLLHEVCSLPLDVQPLVVSMLESRAVEARTAQARVRVIATTSRPLANEVSSGNFLQDLYYCLNVVMLKLPALTERREDVAALAQQFAAEHGVLRLPPEVVEQLQTYAWPGNVRELRNVIRGYAAVGELPQAPIENGSQLAELLRRVLNVEQPYQQQKEHIINQFLDVYLSMLLDHTGGNQTQAARMSGIERAHLNRMISKLRGDAKRPSMSPMEAVGSSGSVSRQRRSSNTNRSR